MNRSAFQGLLVLGGLAILAFVVYGNALTLQPRGGDNLYVLAWADRANLGDIPAVDPSEYPEWRPLAYFSVWLQYQLVGLHAASYFLVNTLLWTACAWLVYRIVWGLTASHVAGALVAAVVLTDARAVWNVVWIVDRQSSLACLFGLLALLVSVRGVAQGAGHWRIAAVFLLLLASALSKEFGLAFAVAIAVASVQSSGAVSAAAFAALIAYGSLRFTLASGAASPLCEEMGYFFSARTACLPELSGTSVSQMLYNVGATVVATLVSGLFDGVGTIRLAPTRLPLGIAWLFLAAVGWSSVPTENVKTAEAMRVGERKFTLAAAALVVAANAFLSFMLFRERNQLVGVLAMAIAAGVGYVTLSRGAWNPGRSMRGIGFIAVSGLIAVQAFQTRNVVGSVATQELAQDPCIGLQETPPIDALFIARLKTNYGLPDPSCQLGR